MLIHLKENDQFNIFLIKITGYSGRAIVVVSCVMRDSPFRAHPHNLVGKENCKFGVCTVEVSSENNMTVSFDKLGIQCVKRKDIDGALKVREKMRVDPFRSEYFVFFFNYLTVKEFRN